MFMVMRECLECMCPCHHLCLAACCRLSSALGAPACTVLAFEPVREFRAALVDGRTLCWKGRRRDVSASVDLAAATRRSQDPATKDRARPSKKRTRKTAAKTTEPAHNEVNSHTESGVMARVDDDAPVDEPKRSKRVDIDEVRSSEGVDERTVAMKRKSAARDPARKRRRSPLSLAQVSLSCRFA